MTLPAFKRSFERQEAWKRDNPEMVAKSEQQLEEIRQNSKPFLAVDTRDLAPHELKLIELQNENESLKIKIAELYSENDELTELLKLAAQKRRYELPVKQVKGFLDFVNGNVRPSIYATFDSNTNVLEHLSID